jgi:pilus assembly protein Flp/PilA
MNAIALRAVIAYQLTAARLRQLHDERGATAVEYALMVGLIAAAVVGLVVILGGKVTGIFDKTNDNIGNAGQ